MDTLGNVAWYLHPLFAIIKWWWWAPRHRKHLLTNVLYRTALVRCRKCQPLPCANRRSSIMISNQKYIWHFVSQELHTERALHGEKVSILVFSLLCALQLHYHHLSKKSATRLSKFFLYVSFMNFAWSTFNDEDEFHDKNLIFDLLMQQVDCLLCQMRSTGNMNKVNIVITNAHMDPVRYRNDFLDSEPIIHDYISW